MNQIFWKESVVDSAFVQRPNFWIQNVQRCQTLSQLLAVRQNLNQGFFNLSGFEFLNHLFYYPSEFESNILQCFRFWRKIFCGKSKFIAKIAWKKNNFFGSSHTVKTIQLALSCCIGKLVSDNFLWKKERFYQSNFSISFSFWNKILKTRQILGQDF